MKMEVYRKFVFWPTIGYWYFVPYSTHNVKGWGSHQTVSTYIKDFSILVEKELIFQEDEN